MHDRAEERAELLHHVTQGRSLLMLVPRRVGKTWLMNKFAEDLESKGWRAVYCDVEGVKTPTDFLKNLCREIQQKESALGNALGRAKHAVSHFFSSGRTDSWSALIAGMDWPDFAHQLVRTLNESEIRTVLLIDELALFILDLFRVNPDDARNFLYLLRSLVQRYPNVRWVFAGSIGLDSVAQNAGVAGALVDYKHFPLDVFSKDIARSYLDLACQGTFRPYSLGDAAFDYLAEELGWLSPFYLNVVAEQVRPRDRAQIASVEDVSDAFEALLRHEHRTYFSVWHEHIDKNFETNEAKLLRGLLDACARQSAGELVDTLAAQLRVSDLHELTKRLSLLVTDGYLIEISAEERPRYRFRSGLLRRYWLKFQAQP